MGLPGEFRLYVRYLQFGSICVVPHPTFQCRVFHVLASWVAVKYHGPLTVVPLVGLIGDVDQAVAFRDTRWAADGISASFAMLGPDTALGRASMLRILGLPMYTACNADEAIR